MPIGTSNILTKLLLVLAVAIAINACGRKGALEAPPSSYVIKSDDTGQVEEEAPPAEDKPFILDPLI